MTEEAQPAMSWYEDDESRGARFYYERYYPQWNRDPDGYSRWTTLLTPQDNTYDLQIFALIEGVGEGSNSWANCEMWLEIDGVKTKLPEFSDDSKFDTYRFFFSRSRYYNTLNGKIIAFVVREHNRAATVTRREIYIERTFS